MNKFGPTLVMIKYGSQKEKLLGVIIDRNLNFKNHVSDICSRANRKLTALGRLSKLYP